MIALFFANAALEMLAIGLAPVAALFAFLAFLSQAVVG